MKKVAIVLSGCGHKDGAEITESVSVLIALSKAGAHYECFAPDVDFHPTHHSTNESDANSLRNCLTEASRIARGHIENIKNLKETEFDAIVFPGGFGAALHLSDWAQKGAECRVHPEVERIIKAFHQDSKPIGAICIAPTLVARVLGTNGISLTIGNNKEVIEEISKTGAQHVECPVEDFITDRLHKVITTPAYMYETQPHKVFQGISGLIQELVEMA
jgi:enhancing lycopene biosynthesis protein 2